MQTPTATPADGYRGMIVEPALTKPDATLIDTSGAPFDFRARTAGRVTLLFLGYTFCPDVCPTHMADIATALRAVPQEAAEAVTVIFVTTDPERDTPERLREWLDVFDTRFIGLTADQETLLHFQHGLRLQPAEKQDLGNGEYAMSHSALVIAFTQDDLAHLLYPFGVTHADWTHDLVKLTTEGWKAP